MLFQNNLVPTPATVIGDLTPCNFDGYAPLAKDAASPSVATDPATGDKIVRIPDPAGGWTWLTTGVTNLPQTVYGYALTDGTGADLYGVTLFDTPVVLTGAGQEVVVGDVTYRLLRAGVT